MRKRNSGRRETMTMIISSVSVLAVLAAAGMFIRGSSEESKDGYVVDFSAMEEESPELAQNVPVKTGEAGEDEPVPQAANANSVKNTPEAAQAQGVEAAPVTENDLDYDPAFRETNSVQVENEGGHASSQDKEINEKNEEGMIKEEKEDAASEEAARMEEMENTMALATSATIQPALTFDDDDSLAWPIVGNVLINYSMDKTVYFPTLEQYKYNPAIVISAVEGETITAAANGKVSSVTTDPELGNVVVMELGNGYELTYGQLKDITVSEGSYVSQGDIIGNVAAPTKYYSVEGCNIYLKLAKDGVPVNPMTKLN